MALSDRGRNNVDNFMPKISRVVAQKTEVRSTPRVDLSTAENWLMREELVELFKNKLVERLCPDDLSYPNGFTGCPRLVKTLANFFTNYWNPLVPVEPAHVVAGPGACTILDSVLFNICNPGDGVLVMTPYWVGFDFVFTVRPSVTVVHINIPDPTEMFRAGITQYLEKALQSSSAPCKALIICNPGNPVGQCYTREALEECLQFCQKENLHFVSDELYALSVFDSPDLSSPEPFISAMSLDTEAIGCDAARVHTVWSVSKDFGSSGLRLGTFVTQYNPSLALGVALAANTQVSQFTAIAFDSLLSQEPAILNQFLSTNRTRLAGAYSKLVSFLKFHGMYYLPTYAGLYVWVRLSESVNTWEEEKELWGKLSEGGVAVSAGKGYHAAEPGWFRITFSVTPELLMQGLVRVEEAMGLKGWVDMQ